MQLACGLVNLSASEVVSELAAFQISRYNQTKLRISIFSLNQCQL